MFTWLQDRARKYAQEMTNKLLGAWGLPLSVHIALTMWLERHKTRTHQGTNRDGCRSVQKPWWALPFNYLVSWKTEKSPHGRARAATMRHERRKRIHGHTRLGALDNCYLISASTLQQSPHPYLPQQTHESSKMTLESREVYRGSRYFEKNNHPAALLSNLCRYENWGSWHSEAFASLCCMPSYIGVIVGACTTAIAWSWMLVWMGDLQVFSTQSWPMSLGEQVHFAWRLQRLR